MKEVTKEKIQRVKELIRTGMSVTSACKEIKLSEKTYYRCYKTSKPKLITLEVPSVPERLIFISGTSSDIMRIVSALK